jgi:hypothetical protein
MGASKVWIGAAIAGAFVLGTAAAETKSPAKAADPATAKKPAVAGAVQHADIKKAKDAKPRKPAVTARAPAKKSTVTAKGKSKAPVTAKAPVKKPVATAKVAPRAPAATAKREPDRYVAPAPSLGWTPPPLGPERFYPNGIPPLHPAFLHPLPGTAVKQEASAALSPRRGGEPEMLP